MAAAAAAATLGAAVSWGSQGTTSCDDLQASRGRCKSASRKGEQKRRLIKDLNFLFARFTEQDGHFNDEYETVKVIGKGAFGTVYTARNKLTGHMRAVKRLRTDPNDPESVEMLVREIQALMALDHPNIVKLIRYFETPSHIYLVFDLCQGPDLGKHIRNRLKANKGAGMPEHEAANILRQMLQSLKRCHYNYIGHFDVKPENFMFETKLARNLKMIDLGLSSGFKKDKSTISGSALYMAPEIWDGIYGPEADIWACGVVFFYMLTGKQLLSGNKSEDEIKELVHDRTWVRQQLQTVQDKGVSKECCELLNSLLSANRHRRPTAREGLRHPVLSKTFSPATDTEADVQTLKDANDVIANLLPSLRSMAAEPVLKTAVLVGVAHLSAHSYKEAQPQRIAFQLLDRHFDGTVSAELSMEGFENYLIDTSGEIPDDLEDTFKGVDVDDDGYISYVEFLAATLPDVLRYNEQLLKLIFRFLDRNNDGVIDVADLKTLFLKEGEPIEVCQEALLEVCPKGQKLDLKMFMKLMMEKK